jgi:hypothetical protein
LPAGTFRHSVAGFVHFTHATLADGRKDFVRAEFCADPLDAAKFATPAAK